MGGGFNAAASSMVPAPTPPAGAGPLTETGQDPKSVLNQLIQRYCARPVQKGEISFTTTKYGRQHQSICKLQCMNGQEVVGELQNDAKAAEKSAALMTLQVYKPQFDALPAAGSKEDKKRKGGALSPDEMKVKRAKKEADAAAGIVHTTSAKMALNEAAMKICKRALQKGELLYEVRPCTGGFQATVKISCLPEQWAEQLWAGEVKTTKQAAEQAAAEICLTTLNTDAKLKEEMDKPKGKGKGKGKNEGKGKGQGKAQAKGKVSSGSAEETAGEAAEAGADDKKEGDKGKKEPKWKKGQDWDDSWTDPFMDMMWMMMAGGDWGWQDNKKKKGNKDKGADLPRTRITTETTLGEVLEWKGQFGFIKPAVPLEHEDSKKGGRFKGDKIYVHKKDVAKDTELAKGAVVRFHVYKDKSGLGAEEVTL